MRRVLYYHAGCPDGFGAAWAAWRAWGKDGEYRPRSHDDRVDPSDVMDDHVVFADIAPHNDELEGIAEAAAQVVVLDHHITALERFQSEPALENVLAADGHRVHFDLEHSGAMLSWQYFHPGKPSPRLLEYVQDQDLWTWELPQSEEVNAAIGSHPFDLEVWDDLAARPILDLAAQGEPIVRLARIEVQRALKTARPFVLDEGRIEAVNSPSNRAKIGHELGRRAAYGTAWGLVYRVTGDRVDASIYSIGDVDVASIARRHGGGGHKNAAGFTLTLREWMERVI
ncbi:MAG: phosphohydrolase [Myxococcales bacterium]|nr:phosphohydrolase [Myxococcales bacterium]